MMNGAVRPYFPHRAPLGRFTGLKRMLLRSVYAAVSRTTSQRSSSPRLKSAFRGVVVSTSSAAQVMRHALMNARNALLLMGALRFVSVIAHAWGVSRRARERAGVRWNGFP